MRSRKPATGGTLHSGPVPGRNHGDGKAVAWTRTWVLFHTEKHYDVFNVWVPAAAITCIPRDESDWQDPYDVEH